MRRVSIAVFFLLGLFAEAASAHPGTGIVVDRRGCVYFTDLKQIWRIDPDGRITAVVRNKHSHALLLDKDGNVDNHKRQTSRLYKKTPRGELSLLAGGAWGNADARGAAARFGSIGAMTVGPEGSLYLTDGPAVRKVAADGSVTTIARGGQLLKPSLVHRFLGGLSNPLIGLAVNGRGEVYVANYGNQRLLRITPPARVETFAQAEWPWSPTGVAIANGTVYILEYRTPLPPSDRVRVRRVAPNGTIQTLAIVGN